MAHQLPRNGSDGLKAAMALVHEQSRTPEQQVADAVSAVDAMSTEQKQELLQRQRRSISMGDYIKAQIQKQGFEKANNTCKSNACTFLKNATKATAENAKEALETLMAFEALRVLEPGIQASGGPQVRPEASAPKGQRNLPKISDRLQSSVDRQNGSTGPTAGAQPKAQSAGGFYGGRSGAPSFPGPAPGYAKKKAELSKRPCSQCKAMFDSSDMIRTADAGMCRGCHSNIPRDALALGLFDEIDRKGASLTGKQQQSQQQQQQPAGERRASQQAGASGTRLSSASLPRGTQSSVAIKAVGAAMARLAGQTGPAPGPNDASRRPGLSFGAPAGGAGAAGARSAGAGPGPSSTAAAAAAKQGKGAAVRTFRRAQKAGQCKDTAIAIDSSGDEGKSGSQGRKQGKGPDVKPLARAPLSRALQASMTDGERYKGLHCVYPAHQRTHAVEVMAEDLNRLDDEEFLNDTIIDFYLKWIQEHLPEEMKKRCYFFNSFFFKKLTEKGTGGADEGLPKMDRMQRNHERVKKWTKGVDLFSYDYVFVPIHESLHWSLAVICHPGFNNVPVLLHLDSMDGSGHNAGNIFTSLREYLQLEWLRLKKKEPTSVPAKYQGDTPDFTATKPPLACITSRKLERVPKQDNHCDCGLFLLTFVEFFCHAAPKSITLELLEILNKRNRDNSMEDKMRKLVTHGHEGFLTPQWFTPAQAGLLREHIRHLILSLMLEVEKAKLQRQLLLEAGKTEQRAKEGEGVKAGKEGQDTRRIGPATREEAAAAAGGAEKEAGALAVPDADAGTGPGTAEKDAEGLQEGAMARAEGGDAAAGVSGEERGGAGEAEAGAGAALATAAGATALDVAGPSAAAAVAAEVVLPPLLLELQERIKKFEAKEWRLKTRYLGPERFMRLRQEEQLAQVARRQQMAQKQQQQQQQQQQQRQRRASAPQVDVSRDEDEDEAAPSAKAGPGRQKARERGGAAAAASGEAKGQDGGDGEVDIFALDSGLDDAGAGGGGGRQARRSSANQWDKFLGPDEGSNDGFAAGGGLSVSRTHGNGSAHKRNRVVQDSDDDDVLDDDPPAAAQQGPSKKQRGQQAQQQGSGQAEGDAEQAGQQQRQQQLKRPRPKGFDDVDGGQGDEEEDEDEEEHAGPAATAQEAPTAESKGTAAEQAIDLGGDDEGGDAAATHQLMAERQQQGPQQEAGPSRRPKQARRSSAGGESGQGAAAAGAGAANSGAAALEGVAVAAEEVDAVDVCSDSDKEEQDNNRSLLHGQMRSEGPRLPAGGGPHAPPRGGSPVAPQRLLGANSRPVRPSLVIAVPTDANGHKRWPSPGGSKGGGKGGGGGRKGAEALVGAGEEMEGLEHRESDGGEDADMQETCSSGEEGQAAGAEEAEEEEQGAKAARLHSFGGGKEASAGQNGRAARRGAHQGREQGSGQEQARLPDMAPKSAAEEVFGRDMHVLPSPSEKDRKGRQQKRRRSAPARSGEPNGGGGGGAGAAGGARGGGQAASDGDEEESIHSSSEGEDDDDCKVVGRKVVAAPPRGGKQAGHGRGAGAMSGAAGVAGDWVHKGAGAGGRGQAGKGGRGRGGAAAGKRRGKQEVKSQSRQLDLKSCGYTGAGQGM